MTILFEARFYSIIILIWGGNTVFHPGFDNANTGRADTKF